MNPPPRLLIKRFYWVELNIFSHQLALFRKTLWRARKSIAKWSEMFLDSVVMMEEGMNITEYAIMINDEM